MNIKKYFTLIVVIIISFNKISSNTKFDLNNVITFKPRVTIITSIYKGDEFIKGFMEDIIRQTIFNECELLLINANSPGNEYETIKEYLPKYPNITYIKLYKDPGLYGVWNMGIKLASADLVTNANLDDRRNPDGIRIQAKALEADKTIDLVYGDYLITYTANQTFENNNYRWWFQVQTFALQHLTQCLPGPQPMWRKSMHEKYGFFNEKFTIFGDHDMWITAATKSSIFYKIPNFLTGLIYENPEGLSSAQIKSDRFYKERNSIIARYPELSESK